MIMFLTRLLAICLGALVMASMTPSVGWALNLSDDKGGYFWREGTFNEDGKKLDPLDLVWDAGAITSTMTEDHVRNVIEQNWNAPTPGGPPPSYHMMTFDQLCLGQRFTKVVGDAGKQSARFRSEQPADAGSGFKPDTTRLDDFQGSTSSHCFSQYHMRFWLDQSVASNIPGYGPSDQFALSGVHHDTAKSTQGGGLFGADHIISGNWDGYRNFAIHKGMRFLCGRSRWQRRPGADHDF